MFQKRTSHTCCFYPRSQFPNGASKKDPEAGAVAGAGAGAGAGAAEAEGAAGASAGATGVN